MKPMRVSEVAELTGVTIRTLHHYDHIGLVRPAARSDGGHRLYGHAELLRLQQVLTLRYLGFSLDRIEALLDREDFDLIASLRAQRQALRDQREEIERIETAITALIADRVSRGAWNWDLVAGLTQTVQEQTKWKEERMERYYTPEQLEQFAELRERTPDEEIHAVEDGWAALLADLREKMLIPPESPEARDILVRWDALTERTQRAFAENQELSRAIEANFQAGNFDADPRVPSREEFAFIERIRAAQEC